MKRHLLISVLGGSLLAAALTFLASCGGTSGGEKSYDGASYVAGDSVGSIAFATLPSSIDVSQVGGFLVSVRDSAGAGVADMQISCDTELGLALIEPSTGKEMTDSGGYISGKVGCERPGSYQIGCRTPVGANKRVFQRVVCSGEVPTGFTGFPGAGGGGLGGGSVISDGGGAGGADVAGFGIAGAVVSDDDKSPTFTVDTDQVNTCGDDGNDTEPFGDAKVSFSFLNESNSTIECDSYSILVPGVGTYGPISISLGVDGGFAPNGGEKSLDVYLAVAQASAKLWAGSSDVVDSLTGFKNVKFTFFCNKENGDSSEEFTRSSTLGVTFANVNRCVG